MHGINDLQGIRDFLPGISCFMPYNKNTFLINCGRKVLLPDDRYEFAGFLYIMNISEP